MAGTAIFTGPNAAQIDGNQVPSLMVVAGTLGTSDTKGTSAPIRVGGDPATGAAYVYNLGPAGSVTLGNTPGGTLDLLKNGTVVAQGIDSGGTKHILSTDTGGTLNVNAAVSISGGTTNVGTVNTGTINTGTINVGTVGGKAASGAVAVQNPVLIAGTDSGGTIYAPLITTAGILQVGGTVATGAGTQAVRVIDGTVTELSNVAGGTITRLAQGSIQVTAGTFVMPSGTLITGSIVVTAGTINAGTIGLGTVQKVRASVGTTAQVSVPGTGAVVLIDANATRKSYIVAHESATGTVYLGFTAASIGVGTGIPLVGNQIFGADDYTGTVFAIMNTGTVKVNYMEV